MRDELKKGENHPAALEALRWIAAQGLQQQTMWLSALSSCAIENNRLAEVCAGTLRRLMNGEMVGERYVLGLAWLLKGLTNDSPRARKPRTKR